MNFIQHDIVLPEFSKGFHLITNNICNEINLSSISKGLCHLFLQHTSASLAINEKADPDVRQDLDAFFDNFCPQNTPYFKHTYEGFDDMPAHIKSVTIGQSLTIPIKNGNLHLGTWQGIYLCEHRVSVHQRNITVTGLGS